MGGQASNAGVDQDQKEINQQLLQEIEKLTREKRSIKREHDRDLGSKNTRINNLLTDLENTKTDLSYSNNQKNKIVLQKQQTETDMLNMNEKFSESIKEYEKSK